MIDFLLGSGSDRGSRGCQALEENLTVVTTDGKFAAYAALTMW
jgi:hypothetical protein